MLNRSLFEAMVIAHWTSINRREAVGLIVRHADSTSVLWFETFDALGWLDEADRATCPTMAEIPLSFMSGLGTLPRCTRARAPATAPVAETRSGSRILPLTS